MSMPFEIEEPAEVDAGARLITVACISCGESALCAPAQRERARCTACWGGSVTAPALLGAYWHPGGWTSWGPAPEPEAERSPLPLAVAGQVMGGPLPGAALSLAAAARTWGWQTRLAYSRGYAPKPYRGSWQEEELVSVRAGGHAVTGRQAAAVYRTIAGRGSWAWRSLWGWGPDLLPMRFSGVGDLLLFLDVARVVRGDGALAAWGRMMARERERAAVATKVRAAENRQTSRGRGEAR